MLPLIAGLRSGSILHVILFIIALYLIFTGSYDRNTKIIWALIVIFIPILGPIAFLIWKYLLKN